MSLMFLVFILEASSDDKDILLLLPDMSKLVEESFDCVILIIELTLLGVTSFFLNGDSFFMCFWYHRNQEVEQNDYHVNDVEDPYEP